MKHNLAPLGFAVITMLFVSCDKPTPVPGMGPESAKEVADSKGLEGAVDAYLANPTPEQMLVVEDAETQVDFQIGELEVFLEQNPSDPEAERLLAELKNLRVAQRARLPASATPNKAKFRAP